MVKFLQEKDTRVSWKHLLFIVMGIKGRRVHMIEELSETIISFQRGKRFKHNARFSILTRFALNLCFMI